LLGSRLSAVRASAIAFVHHPSDRKISQPAVILWKLGHELGGFREFVVSLVKFLLLAVDHSQRKMQSGILCVSRYGLA